MCTPKGARPASNRWLRVLCLIILEFPLEGGLAVDAGAALAIDVAAQGEAHIKAIRSLENDAGGNAHAVATIGLNGVFDGGTGEFSQLIAGATIVAEELMVPSNAGVGLPLSAVVAIQGLGIGNEAIAQLSAQGVVGRAFQIGADSAAVLVYAGTMGKAVVQCCEGTALYYAVLLGQGCTDIKAAAVAGPVTVSGDIVGRIAIADIKTTKAAHLLYAETGTAKDGPAVPVGGSVASVGTEVDALALNSAAAVLSGLMVDGCVVAMGEAVGKGALHSANNTTVVVGIAIATIVLVGVRAKGDDNVAPALIFRRFNSVWTKTANSTGHRGIHAHAAYIKGADSRN